MTNEVAKFRELHAGTSPLVLANAWDAGSARAIESLGAPAIATTSAGVAWALGYKDGRSLPFDEVLGLARRMTRVLNVPLSFDIEHGYADAPHLVADNVLRLIDAGISGINIEDGPDDALVLAAKVEAIRNAASKRNVDIFVNARCDVFLAGLAPASQQVAESISRGNLYAKAGADGLFVPAIHKPEDIKAVVAGVKLPLNVMALSGIGGAEALGELGVRRLSAGSAVSQAIWGAIEELSKDFLKTGILGSQYNASAGYGHLQGLFNE